MAIVAPRVDAFAELGRAGIQPSAAGASQLRSRKTPHARPAAITSTSTLNSGRVKPETIIRVEAGGGLPTTRSRTSM